MQITHADYTIEPGKRGGLVLRLTKRVDSQGRKTRAARVAEAVGCVWYRMTEGYRLSEVTAERFIIIYGMEQ